MLLARCRIIVGLLVSIALLAVSSAARAEKTLSYADLIHRMTDLSRLAVLPDAGETCAEWSSYDRASKYDEKTGKYIHWDANGDGGGIIRMEGGRAVMAEMKGPGCIQRIWSAAAGKGHVKIYLDDQPEPVVDLPFVNYFDGQHAPFAYPSLSYNLGDVGCSGQNLFLPIPYQKSCKVVADKDWGNYYHFTYTTYPAGTVVPTFSAALAAEHAQQIQTVDRLFATDLGTDPAGKRAGQTTLEQRVNVAPGETARVARIDGPRAITTLWALTKFAGPAEEISGLRKLALRITWDGQAKPAVWCPLGDFFGTAPGVNLYKSLTMGMTDKGYYSFWYMPFGKSAVVELVNEDSVARSVVFTIAHAPLQQPIESLGYFHTKWHRDTVELPADRWPDWTMLNTQGRGRFCGVSLHVWNPSGGWWGEGDEKFFVDGEKFPSTFGTGSEDYFGYAWCNPHLFQKPYHAQTHTSSNRGHQSVLRWHIVDNVPFQKSFEADIEKYYKNDRGTLYALTARWYLAADGIDPYEPVAVAERDGYYATQPVAINGIKVLNQPQGEPQEQGMAQYGQGKWRNNQQLWWTGARPGAKLELAVPVARSGKYELTVQLTKARDYGIVQFALDGHKLGSAVDLYNSEVVPTGPFALGVVDVTEGQHKLVVEIVGANPKAAKAYMFGIDRIELRAVK